MKINLDDKKMPKEVTAAISNILKFLEKSEKDFTAGKKPAGNSQKEAEYENS